MNDILTKTKELIANNRIPEALTMLTDAFKGSDYEAEIIQQTNKYNDLIRKDRLGIISFSETNLLRNQIVTALLELITAIGKGKPPIPPEEKQPPQQIINIINSKNVNTGNINTEGGDVKIGDTK